MPRIRSSWLVGSVEEMIEQSFTIDAFGATLTTGPKYLTHADPSLSMLDLVVAQMVAAGLANPGAELLEDRRVRLFADGVFSVTWGSATPLRDFLGHTGNLAGQTSYTAPGVSPYLWSPAAPVTRQEPPGSPGYPVPDATIRVSADGTQQEVDHHITHVWDEWRWDAVPLSRYYDGGGTWRGFYEAVVLPGHRLQLYELVTEDVDSTSPVTLPTAVGTYRIREMPKAHGQRKIAHANTHWRVGLKVRQASEYS